LPIKQNKTTKFTTRFSDNDFASIKNGADNLNLSVAEFIRRSCVDGYYSNIQKEDHHQNIYYHLNKIGNNLNQIAYHVNSGRVIDSIALLKLISIEKQLKHFLKDDS